MFSIEYKYFFQSAKDLSIRRASVSLNVNSSAVVRQVKKLEYNLNTKLFIRNSRGLTLTSSGKNLYDFLINQEAIVLNFKEKFEIEKGKIKGTYRIGMMGSIGTNIISPLLTKYQVSYPDIKFSILAKKPELIIDELINQKLDLGITLSQFYPKSIMKLFEKKLSLGVVTSINHPLQLKDKITFEDLRNYPIVLHSGTISFFKQTNKLINLNPDFLDIRVTTNSLNFITKSLINNKNFITLTLSSSLHKIYADSLIFRQIDNDTTLNTKVGILCLASKKFRDNEKKFNELLIKEFSKLDEKNLV